MRAFQLLPDAVGLDFPDGRSVKADRRGRVLVTDDQAAQIRGSGAKNYYDALIEVSPMKTHSRPDDPACGCGFVYWPWQLGSECPRCGSTLEA